MYESPSDNTIAVIERRLLRALCNPVSSQDDWNHLASELRFHRWVEPDHKVVYEALQAIKSIDPKTRREELPAQVTRMGFPDLDCSIYFEDEELTAPEIERLIGRLSSTTSGQS